MKIVRTNIPYSGRSRWGADAKKTVRRLQVVSGTNGTWGGAGTGDVVTPTPTASCTLSITSSSIYDSELPATITIDVIGQANNQRVPTCVQTENITGGYPSMTIVANDNGTDHTTLSITLPANFNRSGIMTIPVLVNASVGAQLITVGTGQTIASSFLERVKTTIPIDCTWEYNILHLGSDGKVSRGPIVWRSSLSRRFSNGEGPNEEDKEYLDLCIYNRNTYKCTTSYTQTSGQTWDEVSSNWTLDNMFSVAASELSLAYTARIEMFDDNELVVYDGDDNTVINIGSTGINTNNIASRYSETQHLDVTSLDGATLTQIDSDGIAVNQFTRISSDASDDSYRPSLTISTRGLMLSTCVVGTYWNDEGEIVYGPRQVTKAQFTLDNIVIGTGTFPYNNTSVQINNTGSIYIYNRGFESLSADSSGLRLGTRGDNGLLTYASMTPRNGLSLSTMIGTVHCNYASLNSSYGLVMKDVVGTQTAQTVGLSPSGILVLRDRNGSGKNIMASAANGLELQATVDGWTSAYAAIRPYDGLSLSTMIGTKPVTYLQAYGGSLTMRYVVGTKNVTTVQMTNNGHLSLSDKYNNGHTLTASGDGGLTMQALDEGVLTSFARMNRGGLVLGTRVGSATVESLSISQNTGLIMRDVAGNQTVNTVRIDKEGSISLYDKDMSSTTPHFVVDKDGIRMTAEIGTTLNEYARISKDHGLSVGTATVMITNTNALNVKNPLGETVTTIDSNGNFATSGSFRAEAMSISTVLMESLTLSTNNHEYATINPTDGLTIGTANISNTTASSLTSERLTLSSNNTPYATVNAIDGLAIHKAVIGEQRSKGIYVTDEIGSLVSSLTKDGIDTVEITANSALAKSLGIQDDNENVLTVIDRNGITTTNIRGNSMALLDANNATYGTLTKSDGLVIGTATIDKATTKLLTVKNASGTANVATIDSNGNFSTSGTFSAGAMSISTVLMESLTLSTNGHDYAAINSTSGLTIGTANIGISGNISGNTMTCNNTVTKGLDVKSADNHTVASINSIGNLACNGVTSSTVTTGNVRIEEPVYNGAYRSVAITPFNIAVAFMTDNRSYFDKTGEKWKFNSCDIAVPTETYKYLTVGDRATTPQGREIGEYWLTMAEGVIDENSVPTGVYATTHDKKNTRMYFNLDDSCMYIGTQSFSGEPKA